MDLINYNKSIIVGMIIYNNQDTKRYCKTLLTIKNLMDAIDNDLYQYEMIYKIFNKDNLIKDGDIYYYKNGNERLKDILFNIIVVIRCCYSITNLPTDNKNFNFKEHKRLLVKYHHSKFSNNQLRDIIYKLFLGDNHLLSIETQKVKYLSIIDDIMAILTIELDRFKDMNSYLVNFCCNTDNKVICIDYSNYFDFYNDKTIKDIPFKHRFKYILDLLIDKINENKTNILNNKLNIDFLNKNMSDLMKI